jgi:branched-chain amino acid transport system permease protein
MSMTPARKREVLGFGAAIVLVAAVPILSHSGYILSTGVFIGLHSMPALGLGLLLGYAGQVSLGHAAFYGLGAYGSAILTLRFGLNPWLAMVLAAAATGLIAYIVGRPTLKLHGHYLAMATLGFGIIVGILFNEGGDLTGGPSGLPGVPKLGLGSFSFDSDLRMYCLVWPIVLLQVLLVSNLLRSRLGRAIRALRDSEVAARSCAIDTGSTKLLVFVLSAVFAHPVNFVNPAPFGFAFSIELMLMVVVGGAATLWGPVLGAAALTIIAQLLVNLGGIFPPVKDLDAPAFGVILVMILLFRPQGLASLFARKERAADAD